MRFFFTMSFLTELSPCLLMSTFLAPEATMTDCPRAGLRRERGAGSGKGVRGFG